MSNRWMVTGANGNLGRKLVRELVEAGEEVVAVVRSDHAADTVRKAVPDGTAIDVQIIDYTDVSALRAASQGVSSVVHLVGIIKEGGGATYYDAHEASVTALVEALSDRAEVHVTYLSIVGSRPDSENACLASKGEAEGILARANNPSCILRVPMVLGEDDYVSLGLRKRVLSGKASGFRMASLEQPIYSGDVTRAIVQAASLRVDESLDLGGPEILTRAELSVRAGQVFGRAVKIQSIPIGLGRLLASVLNTLLSNPPITPAMLEILDHDDRIDNAKALGALQISELTPLDDMLRATIDCPELADSPS